MGSIRRLLVDACSATLDLLFPRTCASCGALVSGAPTRFICDRCMDTMPLIHDESACRRCGLPLGPFAIDHEGRYCEGCEHLPLVSFKHTVAAGTYDGSLRRAVCRFKYGRKPHLVRALGPLLVRRLEEELQEDPPDVVVAVPLHPARLRERTFDQAMLLASHVARDAGLAFASGVIRRVVDTPALANQNRQQRSDAVKGAFAVVAPGAVVRRSVLLVDDVMTTGATCSECARALKRAGAKEVRVAVLARTP